MEQVYKSTLKDMINMWRTQNNPLMTKGFDGYMDDNNETYINMTDSEMRKSRLLGDTLDMAPTQIPLVDCFTTTLDMVPRSIPLKDYK